MRKGSIYIPILAIVFALIAFGAVGYYWWSATNDGATNEATNATNTDEPTNATNAATNTTNEAVNENENTNITNENANNNASNTNLPNTAPPVNTNTEPADEDCEYDPPEGWLTYTNAEIGYRINYPPDWIVTEIDNPPDEMFDQPVKYITIKKGLYFLAVGVRHVNDTFLTSDRTGVGAGDFEAAGSEMICDTAVSASQLVFENKAKEWFYYDNGPGLVTIDNHKVNAALSFSGSGTDYENLDMANSTELGLARQMMQTLFFTD